MHKPTVEEKPNRSGTRMGHQAQEEGRCQGGEMSHPPMSQRRVTPRTTRSSSVRGSRATRGPQTARRVGGFSVTHQIGLSREMLPAGSGEVSTDHTKPHQTSRIPAATHVEDPDPLFRPPAHALSAKTPTGILKFEKTGINLSVKTLFEHCK